MFDSKEDKEIARHYIKTFSDTAREPFLILDPSLIIVGANESFYKNFQTKVEETVGKLIYDLGNGQWDIPELRMLLENILPEKKVFNDYEVTHEFPNIGLKIMLLNARQFGDIGQILLSIEDITLKRAIETRLSTYIDNLEKMTSPEIKIFEAKIEELVALNKIMTGREIKMEELKAEMVKLKDGGV